MPPRITRIPNHDLTTNIHTLTTRGNSAAAVNRITDAGGGFAFNKHPRGACRDFSTMGRADSTTMGFQGITNPCRRLAVNKNAFAPR